MVMVEGSNRPLLSSHVLSVCECVRVCVCPHQPHLSAETATRTRANIGLILASHDNGQSEGKRAVPQ